jgi:hypothetical protein
MTECDNPAQQPGAEDRVEPGKTNATHNEANIEGKISPREIVRLLTSHLSTAEISSLYLATRLANANPMGMQVYQKAHALFTQNNGQQMHPETIQELGTILAERLNSSAG